MKFILDVGNTTTRGFLFDGTNMAVVAKAPADDIGFKKSINRWCHLGLGWGIKEVVAVSVVPTWERKLEKLIKEMGLKPIWLDSEKLSVFFAEVPEQLGSDRLAALAGAKAQWGCPCIVADLGTALTVDAVDDNCRYVGGVIFPGPELVSNSLHDQTDLIPKVSWSTVPGLTGSPKGTVQGVIAGLEWGFEALISEYVRRLSQVIGSTDFPQTVLTGGGGQPLKNLPEGVHCYDPFLIAKGAIHVSEA